MRPSGMQSRQRQTKTFATLGSFGSLLAGLVCFVSLTASWFWNGLGQAMSPNQTFWYLLLTKLAFNLSFASLFWRHFTLRKNATSPWMLTRFLVPIGRMSLTVFYVAWLVIWFDLLTSLYQWHPSHYFVFEKFNEIIFITLVVSLIAYGIFEGPIRRSQYKSRAARLARHLSRAQPNGLSNSTDLTSSGNCNSQQQGFEFLFTNSFECGEFLQEEAKAQSHHRAALASEQIGSNNNNNKTMPGDIRQQAPAASSCKTTSGGHLINTTIQVNNGPDGSQQQQQQQQQVSDHYKLNAELRANYSFISLGMYEMERAGDSVSRQSVPGAESPPRSQLTQSTQLVQVHKTPSAG